MELIDKNRLKRILEKNFGHTGGASVLMQLIDIQPVVDDCDRWKARAEALERALQQYIPCKVCIHKDEDCEGCEIWLQGPREARWQFDEARFGEGKEDA